MLSPTYKSLQFFSPYIFWLSLSIRIPKGKGEEVKVQGGALIDAQSCSGDKPAKIMIKADRASHGLGWAHQQGFCKDLDWILAWKHLQKQ